jgi:hypothetical protein
MKDKIIFWCGADFTQFSMAYYFQKLFDSDMYSIVDVTNNSKTFFKNQKLINFKKTWFLHDQYDKNHDKPDIEYLKYFEQKYDIDLWQLTINERIFYGFFDFHKFTTNEILSIVEQICKFYEQIFLEIKPDFFITKLTSFHHLELFRRMCIYHGTKVLTLSSPKIPQISILSEDDTKFDYVNSLENIECKEKNFNELNNDLILLNSNNDAKEIVMDYWRKHGSNSKINMAKMLIKFLISSNVNINTNYNYYGRTRLRVLKNSIILILKKLFRESFMRKNLEMKPDLKSSFVYYPLGVVLERHILIGAPYCTNQLEIIRHIAKSLPIGYRLLVKEHPAQKSREWRSISEYSQIMDVPNVTLIHPSFSEKELQKNCSLLISTAGGSAFEAAFYQKPSIIFGSAIFSILPSVKKVDSLENLPKIIRTSLKTKVKSHDLAKFMKILSPEIINFSFAEFLSNFNERFTSSGGYVDSIINENKLKVFLEEKKVSLEYLAMRHIDKINQHKKYS